MNINIIKAEKKHLIECKNALQNSQLGEIYFSEENKAIHAISEGISKEEISVALNEEGAFLGFIWIIPYGAFHSFPYLHMIVVKEEFRSLGIGKKLLKYFEETAALKIFKIISCCCRFQHKSKTII